MSENRYIKTGCLLFFLGIVLLSAAFWLVKHNSFENLIAEENAAAAVNAISSEMLLPEMPDAFSSEICDEDTEKPSFPFYYCGDEYIGILSVPSLDIELPVSKDLSETLLKKALCLYSGAFSTSDAVIAGHNYKSFFADIQKLSPDSEVFFTDTHGDLYSYKVACVETLYSWQVSEMKGGNWSLTLFTCTLSGRYRIAVRCNRV